MTAAPTDAVLNRPVLPAAGDSAQVGDDVEVLVRPEPAWGADLEPAATRPSRRVWPLAVVVAGLVVAVALTVLAMITAREGQAGPSTGGPTPAVAGRLPPAGAHS